MSRIDIYLHIWAQNANETEEQFLSWIRANNIDFQITITEPEPAALHVVRSSQSTWCDMEDAAGWWLISLRSSPRLMELTDDTLIIRISFTTAEAGLRQKSDVINGKDVTTLPTGPVQAAGALPEGLFDDPKISDLTVIAGEKPIYVQRSVLASRLRGCEPPEDGSPLIIDDVPYEVVRAAIAYAYTGALHIENTAKNHAYLQVLAERFGMEQLRRTSRRMVYSCLTVTDALDVYMALGGLSPSLRELICVYIIQSFAEIRSSDAFRRLYTHPTRRSTASLLAILRRMEVIAPHRPPIFEPTEPAGNLDWRRSMAFRSLLANPAVADVHFVVEGKILTAQKSVLSSLSDYFLAMFTRGFQESTAERDITVVEIPDFPYSTVRNMLLYLYVREIDPPTSISEIGYLYVIADKYQVHDLMSKAKSLLQTHIQPDTVTEFLFSFAYKYEPLRRLVLQYVLADFNAVRKSDGFARVVRHPHLYPEYVTLMDEILEHLVVKDFEQTEASSWENESEVPEYEQVLGEVDAIANVDELDREAIEDEEEIFRDAPVYVGSDAYLDTIQRQEFPGKRHAVDDDTITRPVEKDDNETGPQSPRRATGVESRGKFEVPIEQADIENSS
ncbi:hypothetical protein SpCBS45565_g03452 [Spizellomyces sp. 'palustris']|nr:hypothetical protein SpCBS45565_g03452 [Spizellomyces sp. 'palustris']